MEGLVLNDAKSTDVRGQMKTQHGFSHVYRRVCRMLTLECQQAVHDMLQFMLLCLHVILQSKRIHLTLALMQLTIVRLHDIVHPGSAGERLAMTVAPNWG